VSLSKNVSLDSELTKAKEVPPTVPPEAPRTDAPQRLAEPTAPDDEFTGVDIPVKDRLDRRLVMVGLVIALGSIMPALDTTIVNVATRTLGQVFDTSLSTIQWVLTGYLLAFAGVIPITGWATERFGAKRVWIGALLLFMTGATLSATAWSVGSLVAFRIIQGFGAGMIPPVGQTILAQAAGPGRMGRAISLISLPLLLGTVAGPVVGGLVLSGLGWRWIFCVSLPLGVVAVLAAQRTLPKTWPRPGQRLDLRGLFLLSSGVGIFVYGMTGLGRHGGSVSVSVVAEVSLAVALIVLYLVHARGRGRLALIDISLLRERGFAAAVGTNLVVAIGLYGVLLLLPLYWQIVRGLNPLAAGLLIAPQALGVALSLPLTGRLTDKFGAAVVVPFGISLALLGIYFCTQVTDHTSYVYYIPAVVVFGIGQGATTLPLTAAAYTRLSRDAIPRATSALFLIKYLGATLGTAALAITLDRAINAAVPKLSGSALDPLPPATRIHIAPALADAFATTFWMTFVLTALALVPAMLLPRTGRRAYSRRAAGRVGLMRGRFMRGR
jgi:EmrB/QacA subfamily drug resistance transporter